MITLDPSAVADGPVYVAITIDPSADGQLTFGEAIRTPPARLSRTPTSPTQRFRR